MAVDEQRAAGVVAPRLAPRGRYAAAPPSTSSMRPGWTSMPARRRTRPKIRRLSSKNRHLRSTDYARAGRLTSARSSSSAARGSAQRRHILLRLQHDAERLVNRVGVQDVPVESDERGHPVDRLRHAGHFVQVFAAHLLHHRRHLLGQRRRRLRSARAHDRQFLLERRILNPLIQATPFQRVLHFARTIRRQDDERRLDGPHGAELGNGDLELRQQLEQKSLELFVGTIDFVDQQDSGAAPAGIDRLKQRALDEKRFAVQIAPRAFRDRACAVASSIRNSSN